MDVIKNVLNSEIDRINRQEGRDGRARVNVEFFVKHPWLWLAMLVGYIAVGIVMYVSPYMGIGWFIGFKAFLVFMSAMLLLEIKPVYRYEDIGVLDLRVCYNGEWYFSRELSEDAVRQILSAESVSAGVKNRIESIVKNKGFVDFYDVYDLARLEHQQPSTLNSVQLAH